METLRKKSIALLFRKKLPQNNSIEELFKVIGSYLRQNDFDVVDIQLPKSGVSLKSLFQNLRKTFFLNNDVVHMTGDAHYSVLASQRPTLLTIHDIGSALKGNIIKIFLIKFLWFWLPALVVDRITVISEFSKLELSKLIPFAKNKISVIPNPVNPRLTYKPKAFNTEHPTILHLGTKNNKNLERTIEAIRDIRCTLVIIGKLQEHQKQLLENYKIDYKNEYFIAYDKIIEHYIRCDIVCFASTYEGFGMPIVEAQKIGRPVITSNIASMPEVAGKGACLINPFRAREIKNAIERIIIDVSYRNELISLGQKNVERYSIDIVANQYLEIYRQL